MRVTNMKGVDVRTYDFDFDLTFAALLMNADGTIYHRYGGRDWTDPQSHLSVASLLRVLRETLPEHAAYVKAPKPPKQQEPMSVDRMPWMRSRPKQPECYHCHMVHDAMTEQARLDGRFRRGDAWRYPDPLEVGLRVDRDDQAVVSDVVSGSAAAKAGLVPGARLLTLGGKRILTMGDVERALHEAGKGAPRIPVTFERAGKEHESVLRPGKGWKEPTPLVFSWRPSKWRLSPRPGFGGPQLGPKELARLGLPADAFAFSVRYLVTWGEHAHTGRNARKAGLRKGDVVIAVGGKRDFQSVQHFHAWYRLTQRAGRKVDVEILRNKKPQTLRLTVVD